jgi:murein DD-endopeptidase MepM/ murein hydrolase activator NlpD
MYENGNITYIDILLDAENITDMLSRAEIVNQIMNYDQKVVDEYNAALVAIQEAKAALEADKADQESYKQSLDEKYADLEAEKKEQQAIIDKLESDKELKESEQDKMDKEKDSINSEIERLSRIAAEQAAAAAKAKAAAEAAAKNTAKSSSASTSSSSSSSATRYSGTFTWPLPGYTTISSGYGYRTDPLGRGNKLHGGTDIPAPKGTTIVAAASGTVVKSALVSSYGNYIVVDHGGGVMTGYAHMSKRVASVGDTVSAGQKIGEVGSTGDSTGNHLHFEVYINGSRVNAMNYFS